MWEQYYHDFREAQLQSLRERQAGQAAKESTRYPERVKPIIEGIMAMFAHNDPEEDAWVEDALRDEQKKRFVAYVLRSKVPRRFFPQTIRAAVYDENPSFNRQFIEPCIVSFGNRAVIEALLSYLCDGTKFEKAGAANALYWAWLDLARVGFRSDQAADLRKATDCLLLQEFVANEDVDVRRSIIPGLNLDPNHYSNNFKRLIPRAIEIARQHTDAYIRHRVEIQLGTAAEPVSYMTLPHREHPSSNE